jgi:hypothetical protein
MTDLNRVQSSNLDAVTAAGAATPASFAGAPSTWGLTLASGTTYYVPVGANKAPVPAESPLVAIHIRGDAAIIATITIEDCVFPATTSPGDGRGAVDVSDFDATAGYWIPENPSTAIVQTSGPGWVATAATVAVAGSNAGGCMYHVGNLGSRRLRVKIVVGGIGGKVRVGAHGKAAA